MSFWDYKTGKIIRYAPEPCVESPGWNLVDCGCSNGLQWGGDQPIECGTCGGNGSIYHHLKSGALAQYPGGPFVGHAEKEGVYND